MLRLQKSTKVNCVSRQKVPDIYLYESVLEERLTEISPTLWKTRIRVSPVVVSLCNFWPRQSHGKNQSYTAEGHVWAVVDCSVHYCEVVMILRMCCNVFFYIAILQGRLRLSNQLRDELPSNS